MECAMKTFYWHMGNPSDMVSDKPSGMGFLGGEMWKFF